LQSGTARRETRRHLRSQRRLSRLIDLAASGVDVVVSGNGPPLARITRLVGVGKAPIRFGVLKGKVRIAAEFAAPLPPQVLAGFGGADAPTALRGRVCGQSSKAGRSSRRRGAGLRADSWAEHEDTAPVPAGRPRPQRRYTSI
jgi:antitoxin (DNA-binding transcriptional repressor) of toxin-antitoxin stability system